MKPITHINSALGKGGFLRQDHRLEPFQFSANPLHDDSDLGAAPVVTHVGPLSTADVNHALNAGATAAQGLRDRGLISGAALFLRDQHTVIGLPETLKSLVKAPEYA